MKHLIALLLLLALGTFASAQSTTVSATITDAGAQAWNNGTYSFTFQPAASNPTAQYFWNGAPFSSTQTFSGNLSGAATFTASIPSTTSITPSGSAWVVQVCPAARPIQCYKIPLTITGGTQNISGQVIPPAIQINLATQPNGAAAYTDAEIIGALTGSFYFNLNDGSIHTCNGFPPCTWTPVNSATSVLTSNNSFTGVNTFTQPIVGSITGNAGSATTAVTATNLQGPGTISGNYTSTGQLLCKNFENVRCADQFATLQAAINDCSAGCEVYIPFGLNLPAAPTTQITITHTVWIHGAGIGQTVIQPTAALASALFSITAANASVKFSDLTIDMTNAPTIGALSYNTVVRPILENVQILYPSTTGTGTAILEVGTGEMHMRNIIMHGAGICVDENGNASGENFYDDIVCEDPGSFGYRRQQTTSTDVGGEYLTHFKVTNPDNRTGSQAFLVTSTAANTGSPFWCLQCIGDNIQGGHTMAIHNMVNVFLDTPWMTNSAASGSNFAGINIDNSTNVFIKGGYLASLSRDLVLSGTDTSVVLRSNFFAGSNTNIYAAGATLGNIVLRDPLFTASTPISTADRSLIANAPSTFLSANAFRVDVSGTGTGTQSFQLHDADSGDATPNAFIRTGANVGTFQLLNNSFAQVFAVNQAGTVATLGASRVMFHGYQGSCVMAAATTCTFSIFAAFTSTPLTYVSIDASSTVPATANSAKCSVSGTTVTITAGISNSLAWDCLLVGAPD